jgi:hypothetical protein
MFNEWWIARMDLLGEGRAKFRLRRPLCRAKIFPFVNKLWQPLFQGY